MKKVRIRWNWRGLTLALFVAGVLANDAHHTLPANNPAGFTEFLDGRPDFHEKVDRVERWWSRSATVEKKMAA